MKFMSNINISNSSQHLSIVFFLFSLVFLGLAVFVCVFKLFTNILLTLCLYCL